MDENSTTLSKTVAQGPIYRDRLLVDIISLARALNILSVSASTWTIPSPLKKKPAGIICHPEPSPSALHPSELFHSCHQLNHCCEIRQRIFSSVSDPQGFLPGNNPWGGSGFYGLQVFATLLSTSASIMLLVGFWEWLVAYLKLLRKHPCSLQHIKAQPRVGHHTLMSAKEGCLTGTSIICPQQESLGFAQCF